MDSKSGKVTIKIQRIVPDKYTPQVFIKVVTSDVDGNYAETDEIGPLEIDDTFDLELHVTVQPLLYLVVPDDE